MPMNLAQKIISEHLVGGEMEPGSEIAIKIDQTLTQDATGTMAYLQFEALDIPKVRTELSVSYVDHNMLQTSFENADDHASCRASPLSTASSSRDLATASATRSTWSGSASPARPSWAPTRTLRRRAAWVLWRSAPAASTSPSR